jgi:flagellar motor switch protein FliG
MEQLPTDTQLQVFNDMLSGATASEDLLNRIVRTTVEKGMLIEQEDLDVPNPDEKMAGLLRELPKSSRSRMMDQLQETDEETAERIQALLYVFDDIEMYDDRSIQKILGEVDKSLLVISLQDASDVVKKKILTNLSKRARSALEEELEFHSKESSENVSAARDSITAIIAKLDQADQIQREES